MSIFPRLAKKCIFVTLIGCGLTACQFYDGRSVWEMQSDRCSNYGFVQGTVEFAECMQRESHNAQRATQRQLDGIRRQLDRNEENRRRFNERSRQRQGIR